MHLSWFARQGLLATLVLAGLTACGSSSSETSGGVASSGEQLLIATTVSPLTSIAASVAGDRARVEGIVPEGTNSHTFEPEPSVAELLSTADVIFVNGLKLEDPTLALAETNKKPDAEIVEIGTTVLPESDYLYDFSFPKEGGKPNPHLWTDPTYAAAYAAVIADTLAAKDPANADYYQTNAATFEAKAAELAAAVRKDQATVPQGNLTLLTYHDAYAYFAKEFGWKVIGAIQPQNFADPSPQDVVELINQVKAKKVTTIFGSEVFPSSVLKEVADATGARYESSLRDDDLPGQPGDAEHSWLGLMRYDFVTMVTGLGGTATNLEALSLATTTPDRAVYPQ
ncbi:MAG: zinc ABC transporter substrate-binding protein [Actinobacteria bacterium]|uniref:Unannotated protein n=1 Tax=freshwater metagenome TaxID=449393 RepID=A0A6J7KX43_9ZZZZ|nr:zinc ABC transporter substrate-binding protein [Actinomycetota bacterium]